MKKISLFLSNAIREQIARVPSLGIQKAIMLPSELIKIALIGGLDEQMAKDCGGKGWKHFHSAHAEFNRSVEGPVRDAYRIESEIHLLKDPFLSIEIKFYHKHGRSHFAGLDIYLNQQTGIIETIVG